MTEQIIVTGGRKRRDHYELMNQLDSILIGSRIDFPNSDYVGLGSFHVSHWEGARYVVLDELTDAEDNLLIPYLSLIKPKPRGKKWLEPFKVTSIKENTHYVTAWRKARRMNMQKLEQSNHSNKIITIGDDTFDLDRLKRR